MLNILTASEVRTKLLTLFVLSPDSDYYLKGLVRHLGENNNAVRRELNRLEAIGFLSTRRTANVKYYRLNRSCSIYPEIKGLVLKTTGIAAVLSASLSELGQIDRAFIYGSYASGKESNLSDIDLMIVGHVDLTILRQRLRQLEHDVGREINETVYSPEEFADRYRAGDAFLQRVLAAPRVVLIGEADESPRRHDGPGPNQAPKVQQGRN